MTEHAGERLFQAMEQIPEDIILEAAQEPASREQAEEAVSKSQFVIERKTEAAEQGQEKAKAGTEKLPHWKWTAEKLGGYLKYLPVAACLCIVFGGAGYVIANFKMGSSAPGIYAGGGSAKSADEAGLDLALEDAPAMDDGTEESQMQSDGGMLQNTMPSEESAPESGMQSDSGASEGGAQPGAGYTGAVDEKGASENGSSQTGGHETAALPVRFDTYEGPVFSLTATGDTQKLKISRSLKAAVSTGQLGKAEAGTGQTLPLLRVTDTYQIKNTSDSDKTLQLVYPFVTAFGEKQEGGGQLLHIQGEPQAEVSYSIGESICAYRGAGFSETSAMEDYQQIFNEEADYQEQALEKEAGWSKKVWVYTFSDIRLRDGAQNGVPGVVGVTVNGEEAKVLTYGFDHSFEREDGSSNHCFFVPGEQEKLVLIVTGVKEAEPQVGYYSNLDCVERLDMDGLEYHMRRQEMSYTNALRICSNDAVSLLRESLKEEQSGEDAAPYINAQAALRALTMIGEEEGFYDTLTKRYQSTELKEVFERLFGETRAVFARATVTIPAKKSVQVTARIQKAKQPDTGGSKQDAPQYAFDLFSAADSQLTLKKTAFSLTLADGWELAEQDLGLKRKKASVWKAVLSGKPYSFSVREEERK